MEITKHLNIKKILSLDSIFIFLFLILFPFGQVIRIGVIQPIDLVVGCTMIYTIVKKLEYPEFFKHLKIFLVFAATSWIFSIFIFERIEVLYGLLYLFRLSAYMFFGVYVWNFVKKEITNRNLLLNSLLAISIVSAFLGWIQFVILPDIKPFFVWGWDMHLFRIVGTFLDPTFLSLIIVFGSIISVKNYIDTKKWLYIVITIFLLITLAFTYSRAGYLAFIAGISALVFLEKKYKKLLFLGIGLIVLAFSLPTSKNHSIELFRTFSAVSRIENYKQTINLFSKSPVFGVGYNNMCIAYQKYIGVQDFSSHACSGSDSSILFILATTGVIGLIALVFGFWRIMISLPRNSYFIILGSSFVALLVHSLFGNSMFYPWIMGWMVILLSLASSTH